MLTPIQSALSAALVERDAEVRAVLLGLLARENVLFVGPPGTAKSLLATSAAAAIGGAQAFQVLLTKFTTPEEVFGPVSITALKQDRYERITTGYAPDAHILFVDEIWKASSAILNTLLTLLNERAFDNGGRRIACPLRLAIAASNEWPDSESGKELGAIFDRFMIRRTVRPVSRQGRDHLLYGALPAVVPVATLADVDVASAAALSLPVGAEARACYEAILDELADAGIRPGDRRIRKALNIARAAAYLAGAAEVERGHLEDLSDALWGDPGQADKCAEIVTRNANPTGARINELLAEVDEAVTGATDAATRMATIKKLEDAEAEMKKLTTTGNGRAAKGMAYIRRERIRLQAAALGIDPAKAEALMGAA